MTGQQAQRPARHDPGLDTWDCQGCGEPWPCGPALTEMAGWQGRSADIYLAGRLEEALASLTDVPPAELRRRFLGSLPGTELGRRNRMILEERLGWPSGTARMCAEAEDMRPAWQVGYQEAYREQPARFVAHRRTDNLKVVAPDIEALIEAIDEAPPRHRITSPPWKCYCDKCT